MPEVVERYLACSGRLRAKSRIYEFLGSDVFSGISCEGYAEASAPMYLSNVAWDFPALCYDPDFKTAKLKRMSQVKDLYSDLDNRTTCVVIGTTGTVTFSEAPSSPSAYPKFVSGYINQLQTINRTLESRVENLETRLAELQKYLPTIKKLVYEHGSAANRVSTVLTQLGRRYDPTEAWKIAEKRDVLKAPPPDEYSEIV